MASYTGYDMATGQQKPALPTGFSYDSNGGVVDAQGYPVQIDAGGNPVPPEGSGVTGYDANGFPQYSTAGLDLSHKPAERSMAEIAATGGLIKAADGDPMGAVETIATGGTVDMLNKSGAGDAIMDPISGGVSKGTGYVSGVTGIGGGSGSGGGQTALAQSEVANPKNQANLTYARALDEATRASGYRGPEAITAGQILLPDQLQRANYWNSTPTAAESVDATGKMRRANTTDVEKVAPATVTAINTNIPAPKLGDAARTDAVTVGKVQADPLADALRAEQIRAASNIATAPSAVKPTMQAGQADALRDALAVASQARGNERAGARREAILASQQGGLAAALKAAALGAQEEQAKRTATAEALGNIRSQDVASSQARQQIEAQRVALQANLDAAIAQGNTAAINEIKKQQAAFEVQARTAEVQAGLTQQGTMADVAKANLGVESTRALANAAATNTAAADYAKSLNAAAENAAARQTATNVTNAQAAQAQAEANMARAAAIEQQNVANTQAARTQNAANALDAAKTNAQLEVEAERTRQSGTTSALNTGNVSAQTGVNAANTVVDANKSQSAANASSDAATKALIGAGITAAATAYGGPAAGAAANKVVSSDEDEKKSDARVKADISPVGTGTATYDELEEGTRQMHPQQMADTRRAFDAIDRGDMAPTPNSRDWARFFGRNAGADFGTIDTAYALKKAAMRGEQTSDERTKREVDNLDSDQIQDWGDKATQLPVTYRYKPGIGDDGKDARLGVLAQELESTGPIGKILVHKDEQGVRSVDYGPAALMMGKAAFDRATEARDLARALTSAASGMPSRRADSRHLAPALALEASRSRKAVR